MTQVDTHSRTISYLRVSVTDRCNLRCVYCMPPEGIPWRPHTDILRYEEIAEIVRAAAELGITKVRLTGGEPLVRPGVAELVKMIAAMPGIDDLSMTTNGVALKRHAHALAQAGLHRVNISLDTLRPSRYESITRLGHLEKVFEGMHAAQEAGLSPIKINTVVIRGLNDDEVVDFARQTVDLEWNVRFIEVMPIGQCGVVDEGWRDEVVTAQEIRDQIERVLGPLEPAKVITGGGPARYYRLPDAKGTIGFITPVSEHFCTSCNRLRLTADGQLRPCLLSDQEIDLRTPLRLGADRAQIRALILEGIRGKPDRHHLSDCAPSSKRVMSEIGG
ncbi:MAG: GTP 3',8-cyclase MoaA [Chloroflexi bacterium]|nr:GTP 3',8-cyclase MoaA [Chloroflexota bacterium]